MTTKLDQLVQQLGAAFGDRVSAHVIERDELSIDVPVGEYLSVMAQLRDDEQFAFSQLTDLSGIDYLEIDGWTGRRFAAVVLLLSMAHNWRLRVRVFAEDDEFPVVPSVTGLWNGANWYEREAFDFYGIHFDGHDDLRRILTDYGFVGHPFRKDFPVSGYVEMRYDPEQSRVIYQPVTIEPRENTPRIIREETYGKAGRA